LAFSDNFSDCYSDSESNSFDNKIIILKKVKSLRQLRRTEKELVRLCYKEAIIKGFTLKGIQQYIASKTKIWIEWSCLEFLKKAEEHENREWYLRLAQDHFAYIGVYRKCIDEVELYKEGLWSLVLSPEESGTVKVAAYKELHNLSKTSVLLLKDLPFVMNLSKYYDPEILDPKRESLSRLGKNPNTPSERAISFLDTITTRFDKRNVSTVYNTLERIESGQQYSIDDELTRRLRDQAYDSIDKDIHEDMEEEDNNSR
jgi:hypothetical protein